MKHAVVVTGLLAILALPTGDAAAQGRPNLVVEIQVQREITQPDGNGGFATVRQAVEETQPDDVLVYTLRWRNTGDAEARGAVLKDPVPEGTVLMRESLAGAVAEVTTSIDGQTWSDWPQEKTTDAQGKEIWKDVPEEAVRHIRWRLAEAVPPGGSGETSFKVLVQ